MRGRLAEIRSSTTDRGGRGSWQSAGDGAARGGRRAGHIPRGSEEIAGIPPAPPRPGHPQPARRIRARDSGPRARPWHCPRSYPSPKALYPLSAGISLGPQSLGETWRETPLEGVTTFCFCRLARPARINNLLVSGSGLCVDRAPGKAS